MDTVRVNDFLASKLDCLVIGAAAAGLVIAALLLFDSNWVVGLVEASLFRKNAPNTHVIGSTGHRKLRPEQYDVDARTGFFPAQPLPRLPEVYAVWEQSLADARGVLYLADNRSSEALAARLDGEKWRADVRSWPVLSVGSLRGDLRHLQRAHKMLAFILHYYAHSVPKGGQDEPVRIPRSLAIPLAAVSKELGIAPVLTFADTVLWNWDLIDPGRPLSIDNMRYVDLLSGSETEASFYKSSAAIELKGAEMLRIIEHFVNMTTVTSPRAIADMHHNLQQLKRIVNELTDIFSCIRSIVDPHVFYWIVRPWWMGAGKLSNGQPGWFFEGVPDYATFDLSGPSGGQSAVMHALDIFLDVDHRLSYHRSPAPSEANKKADRGFMERMRRYMPGLHCEYLKRIAMVQYTVREVAEMAPSVREPYNAVVASLQRLREVHIQVACFYVITQARTTPPASAGIAAEKLDTKGTSVGTGGNDVASLLKAGRDATHRAMIH
ncbi:unnamed protein product [Somion occarium]|uniref:Indoleamine 2,3-dioxygenase n=1 Tax=Somion occarium TaxID=3059160 RepID=A0ABP1D2P6_9APHY